MSHKLKKAEKRFINAENTMKGLARKGMAPSATKEVQVARQNVENIVWRTVRSGKMPNVKFSGRKVDFQPYVGNHQVKLFPQTGEIRHTITKKTKKAQN